MVLGPAVSLVSIDPEGADDRSARNAHALAQGGLSLLLALEIAIFTRPLARLADRPYQAGRGIKEKNRSHPAMNRVMDSF